MTANILLVVKDPDRKAIYLARIDGYGAACNVVCSLQEAITKASEVPHSGILIDMLLMVRITASLNSGVEDLLNGLPSATLNIYQPSGDVRIFLRGTTKLGCASVEMFVKKCTDFPPKIIFPRNRETFHFNALVDLTPDFKKPDRTVCIDMSAGGCFLFSVREDLAVGSSVWIKIAEIGHGSPLRGVVTWIREWGTTKQIPGIGITFVNVSEEFIIEISKMNM